MKITWLLLWVVIGSVYSQENLTLNLAIEQALQNNYAIRIARSDAQIDRNNRSWGKAGLLPQLAASASTSHSLSNSKQTYVTGNVLDRNNAVSDDKNFSVNLNWTLFDGLAMFTNLKKLREYCDMGEIETRQAVENTLSQVVSAYFDIVQQKQKFQSLQEAVAISEQRMKISDAKYTMGSESRFDLLSAKVDLNQDRSALLRQEIILSNAKTLLNQLLSRNVDLQFDAVDSIGFNHKMTLPQLREELLNNNSSLLWAKKNYRIAELDVAAAWAPRFPKVGISAGYSIARSESQSGIMGSNKTYGYTYGLNASYTLFDGFDIHRKWQNARVLERSNELRLSETESRLDADLTRAFQRYSSNIALIGMEAENVGVAHENVNVSIEKYRLGSITALQMRDIQIKYLDAVGRLISAQYLAKTSEVELQKLSGGLVKVVK